MFKTKWFKVFAVLVAGLLVLNVLKDQIVKTVITVAAGRVTGAQVSIRHFSLNLFTQSVHVKGFKMYNPRPFPKEIMADIPEVFVKLDLPALFGGKVHLPLIVFDMKEMVVVKNEDGVLNVDSLKVADPKEAEKKAEKKEKKSSAPPVFKIDLLKLNIGRVVVKDYSLGEKSSVLVYDVGLKEKEFRNITSPQQMAALVTVQALSRTAVKGAKVYAAATILGAGFLPAGVAGMLLGKDDTKAVFDAGVQRVFEAAQAAVEELGEIKTGDPADQEMKANIQGTDVTLRFRPVNNRQTEVTVSARKMMLPKEEIAGGVLYQIERRL